jgi:very-short-patch-repair endonuclease
MQRTLRWEIKRARSGIRGSRGRSTMRSRELPRRLRGISFTVQDGREAGLSKHRMLFGDLDRPFRSVRSSTPPRDTVERCRAYASRMSELEFFCGATAGLLYGVPLPRRHEDDLRLHVAVPNPGRAPRSDGIIGHKYVIGPGEVVQWRGVRLSSPERMWCELGPLLALDELVVAGDHLIRHQRPLTSRARLAVMLERYPDRRGRRRLQRAIVLLDGRSESPGESRLRVLLVENGLTGFELNHAVDVPGTRGGYRLDFAFVAERVAIEYQGAYHSDEAQWRADMTRVARLEAQGWRVILVNKDDLRDPAELVARIRSVLAARAVA